MISNPPNEKSVNLTISGPVRTVFHVRNFEECRVFYESILGLCIDREWNHRPDYNGPGHLGVVYNLGQTHLELLKDEKNPIEDKAYLYIPLKDVDVVWNILSKLARVIQPIESSSWGHRYFMIADPAGIKLKFFSEI